MRTVFLRHYLGRGGCGPERFRHDGKKVSVVGYRIGTFYRVYHLFDVWIKKREKNWVTNIAYCIWFGLLLDRGSGN